MLARDPVKTSNAFAALNARSASESGSKSVAVLPSDGSSATTPTSSNGDKKKRKKSKKKAGSGASASSQERARSGSDTDAVQNKDATTNEMDAEVAELPLAQRLEMAASHHDLHAALVGLLGWSRLVKDSDTILTFFQCNAMALLLENVLKENSNVDAVYDNLTGLLANCLSAAGEGANPSSEMVARTIVKAVQRMAATFNRKDGSEDDSSMVTSVAQRLNSLVLQHRTALHGVHGESSQSQTILRIEADLANAAKQDCAVKGQSIRDSFQRRDIRSDALDLYEQRLAAITTLVHDSMSCSAATTEGEQDSKSSLGIEVFKSADPDEVEAVHHRRAQLQEQQTAALEPIKLQQQTTATRLEELNTRREALEEELRVVNAQIDDVLVAQTELEKEASALETTHQEERERFDSEHRDILRQVQQKQQQDTLIAEFSSLEKAISSIVQEQSEVRSLRDKQAVCLRQQLEGVLRYFGSELPCVKFMLGRLKESESKLRTVTDEMKRFESLGVTAVVEERKAQCEALQSHITEDEQCIRTLQQRDLHVLGRIEELLSAAMYQDGLAQVNAQLKKEVQRHVDYVKELYQNWEQERAQQE